MKCICDDNVSIFPVALITVGIVRKYFLVMREGGKMSKSEGLYLGKTFLFLAVGLFVAGCEAGLRGEPEAGVMIDRNGAEADMLTVAIRQELTEEKLTAALRDGASSYERNQIIFARLAEIDRFYFSYELELSREARKSGLFNSIVGVAAGIGGTLAGSEAVSQGFSAASTAVAGTSAAFSEEVLIDKTIQALTAQMRAGRNEQKTNILGRMTKNTRDYPLLAALADIESYRQAGTLLGALLALTEQSTNAEKETGKKLEATATTLKLAPLKTNDFLEAKLDRMFIAVAALPKLRALQLANDPPGRTATIDTIYESHISGGPVTNDENAREALKFYLSFLSAEDVTAIEQWEAALGVSGGGKP